MKTALITGVSGNLGHAVAEKFLAEGYKVIGTVLSTDPATLNSQDGKFEKVAVDLTDEVAAKKFAESVISRHEIIHTAVLTVGGFATGNIAVTTTHDINKQFKLNFETAYNIARPVFLHMLEQGSGRIFLIGSRPGLDAKAGKGMTAYSLGKSLIFRLAELMNTEAKGTNVVASVIVPSTIDTPQNRKAMPDADFNSWVKPEAIADVICFYCSDAAAVLREPVIKLYGKG